MAIPTAAATPFELFFELSTTGAILYEPVYEAAGELVDFTFARLNPAAQRLLGLPALPAHTCRAQFPDAGPADFFSWQRQAFLSGQPAEWPGSSWADGRAPGYHARAQRAGAQLLVSFPPLADAPRAALARRLRRSQARELVARREAQAERQHLRDALLQLPAHVAVQHGPDHVFTLANSGYQRMAPGRALLGRPIRETWPELAGPGGILDVLDRVYQTGEPFHGTEVELLVDVAQTGQLEQVYLNASFLPLRDAAGRVYGVLDFSYDVTAQVRARQQLEQLNAQLEARVQERTQQLSEQQRLLSQILAQVPAAIATLSGPEHRYTFLNTPYQVLASGRSMLGCPVAEAFPEVVEQGFVAILDQVYATGQPFVRLDMPAWLRHPATGHAEPHYLDLTYQPLHDAQGQTAGILVFSVEVTEKVRARQQAEALQAKLLAATQHQVQERETLYQVFAQTPAAICIQRGPAHQYTYANQAYQDFLPGRQLLGHGVAEALPETVASGVVDLLDRVYQTGETYFGYELPLLVAQPTGPPRQMYFTFTYQAYRENGAIVGISTFAYDVAEQVRARQQREAQARQFQALYEHAPMAVCILRGPEFIVELANPAILHIWGLTAEESLGKPRLDLIPATTRESLRAVLETPYRTRQTHHVQEFPVVLGRTHSGQPDLGYFNFIYQPMFDAAGQPEALTCVGIEVTQLVLARQQVQQLNHELQAANDQLGATNQQLTRTNVELDTFVYTASHDLKHPIANIEGILHALHEHLPADVQQDELVSNLLAMLQESVERFQLTISQLTDISKLQLVHAGPAEPVAVAAVVADVRRDLLPALQAAATQFTVTVPPDLVVSFAPANLRSIIYNLLSNAVKYRDPDRPSVVRVHAARTPTAVVLTVQDNGLGLTPVQQQRLFGLFQRLHTHVEGTGMGLYILKRLVENAGGTVAVQSEPGVGSTFTVTFSR